MNDWVFNSSSLDKFFVGSDKILKTLSEVQQAAVKAASSYPPYNIAKVDDNKYVIELAVAGFTKNNIEIEIANNVLTVKGGMSLDDMYKDTEQSAPQYIYKGIADRMFTRKFTVADTVEVKNAELVNGMLKLWLENIIPDEKKPKKIKINE